MPHGIRIDAVCPGAVPTREGSTRPRRSSTRPTGRVSASVINPLSRFGGYVTPDQVANTVLFPCSDRATTVTGAQYVVDGARTAAGGAFTEAIQS